MRFCLLLVLLAMFCGDVWSKEVPATGGEKRDSLPPRKKYPSFLAINGSAGTVFPTNDFVAGANNIPVYASEAVKFAFTSTGDSWEQIAYGMPYYGLGIYMAHFGRTKDIGNPVSIFLLQGATITQFSRRLALNYELNLGVATNWEPYDPFTNPKNEVIGSELNAHVGGNIHLKWYMSKRLDLNFGVGVNHFSNGSMHQPNSGINTGSVFFELAYNFNRDEVINRFTLNNIAPPFKRHFEHDVSLILSSKNREVDTVATGLPNIYNDRMYKIYGLSYSLSTVPNYKYKYGVGIDMLYDESSGVTMSRRLNPVDNKIYDVVQMGKFNDRMSLGVSVKGEIALPYYSIFANLGYNIIHGNKEDMRLYQVLGVKIYLKDNLFGTFGIRANNFSQAQFLYWSLGYTIKARRNHYQRHK